MDIDPREDSEMDVDEVPSGRRANEESDATESENDDPEPVVPQKKSKNSGRHSLNFTDVSLTHYLAAVRTDPDPEAPQPEVTNTATARKRKKADTSIIDMVAVARQKLSKYRIMRSPSYC